MKLVVILLSAVVLTLSAAVSWQFHTARRDRDRTVTALCAFRHGIQVERDNGIQYLRDHPQGLTNRFHEVLIPASQIAESIRKQTDTLKSLRSLPCPA